MTRIIAGAAKGRQLRVPRSGVRPTSSRVREAVFSTVAGLIPSWSSQHVLDMFAGSGALGLEALSRGAVDLTLVEQDRRVAAVLRRNVAAVGLGGQVLVADALRMPPNHHSTGATLLLIDPPYALPPGQIRDALLGWVDGNWVAPDALIVLEGPASWSGWQWPAGFEEIRSRRYGDSKIWYGSAAMLE